MLTVVRKCLMLALSLSIINPIHCTAQKLQPTFFSSAIPSGCPVETTTTTVTTAACPTITRIVPPVACLNRVCLHDLEGSDERCPVVVSTTTVGCPGRCCPTPPAEVKSTPPCPDCRCQTTYETVTEGC